MISNIVSCINEFEALLWSLFLMFLFFVDQVITRGGGFYRVDMNFSYLRGNCRPNDLNLLLIMKLTETVWMITTPFAQTDWLSTSNLFFILPLSYIFSSKKIFIVISVMRERVGSIHDTFNLYLASWWSICSCNLHLSLQLLISVFLNCAEISFHESGYFMAKVSIIQSN